MINKQNLWFLTLFSLILVLSVYYITMPNELLLTNNSNTVSTKQDEEKTDKEEKTDTKVSLEESEVLIALRVNLNEERQNKRKEIESLLTDTKITSEEKNNAYNELQQLNEVSSLESNIEKKIKDKYKFPTFVKIDDKEITVVIDNDKHDTTLANDIMRLVQEDFKEKVYITVQFK